MRARRRNLHLRLLAVIVVTYIVGSIIILLWATLPPTRQGLLYLQQGQQQLISNPKQAITQFEQADQFFTSALDRLQKAPFLLKAVTPLPPFRWQVRLLKAAHALSLAGIQASHLSSSFPALVPKETSDLESLLQFSSRNYVDWFLVQRPTIVTLRDQLQEASIQLDSIPAWIIIGQKQQVEELQEQVRKGAQGVKITEQLSRQSSTVLGSSDTALHSVLFLIQHNNHTISYATATGRNGSIEQFNFASKPPLNSELSPFYPLLASQLSEDYKVITSQPAEIVISLDSSLLADLLNETGPLTLSRSTLSSFKDASLTTPILAEAIPFIINKLSSDPKNLASVSDLLAKNAERKSLQMWSRQSSLNNTLNAIFPTDAIPDKSNWVKVIGSNGKRDITISQASNPLEKILYQKVIIAGESQDITIILPTIADAVTSASSFQMDVQPTWKQVSIKAPAEIRYQLPYTPENQQSLFYIKQAGTIDESLHIFNFNGKVEHNLLLTK